VTEQGDLSGLVADVVAGRWRDPATGQALRVATRSFAMAASLAGQEAELVAGLGFGPHVAVVSGPHTHAALGRRVEAALRGSMRVTSIVLPASTATEAAADFLTDKARQADALVAVGGGAICDLAKLVSFRTGRPFCVFPTSAAMNGYTTASVSLTLTSGLKSTVAAHPPLGLFVDLNVLAKAPPRLLAAGLGDNLSRFSAQVDWWVAHRLLGTPYLATPYLLQQADEAAMLDSAGDLAKGDPGALACLVRVATLSGFGVAHAGTTHPGSMSEHAISHYIDMVARPHPGTLHGEQVGLASIQMTRLQARILLADAPPHLTPTRIDAADMERRYGAELAAQCLSEHRKKALDAAGAARLNARLQAIWPALRGEVAAMLVPWQRLARALEAAGGSSSPQGYGIDDALWSEAVLHARELRNRFTILDLADDAGLLRPFVAGLGSRSGPP
jgi:glycerol-1-phosphate dehydrogenase [NAD(P)+]